MTFLEILQAVGWGYLYAGLAAVALILTFRLQKLRRATPWMVVIALLMVVLTWPALIVAAIGAYGNESEDRP